MSSKQGPHAMGMRTSANGHGGRNHGDSFHAWGNEAEDMSSKQAAQKRRASERAQRMRRNEQTSLHSFAGAAVASAPHAMGMRTSANGHGGRNSHARRHAVGTRSWT
jgi:hypothetical protein